MNGISQSAYDRVAEEIKAGDYKTGLQARAIAECAGDEVKSKARYIELRAKEIFAENEIRIRQDTVAKLAADAPRRQTIMAFIIIGAVVSLAIFFLVISSYSPARPSAVSYNFSSAESLKYEHQQLDAIENREFKDAVGSAAARNRTPEQRAAYVKLIRESYARDYYSKEIRERAFQIAKRIEELSKQ